MEKSIINKIVVVTLLSTLILSAFPAMVGGVAPPVADAIWIEPYPSGINFNTSTVSVGHEFSIVLWAKSSKTCGAWSFRLVYNKDQLEYINCSYTGPGGAKSMFFKDIATVPVSPSHAVYNATHNRIDFGESWGGVGPMRPPGSDSLAIIFFRVKKVPFKYETLQSVFGISEFDVYHMPTAPKTYLIDEVGQKYGQGFDIPYKFTWAAPPAPYLISAPNRFYDRYTKWVGTTFTETITLNVDPAWFLTNATFVMNFNQNFLEIKGVTIDPTWNLKAEYTIDNLNGRLQVNVATSANIGGNVPVAEVTFNITAQGTYPTVYTSKLSFTNVVFYDHVGAITPGTHVEAIITVEGYLAVHMPHLEVEPNVQVHGPEYAIGKEIKVNIDIKRLHFAWKLVGIEFRLNYDPTVLEVVEVAEGPYFGGYAPYGTWFQSYIEPDYWGPHILVGTLILPNASGVWNPPFPGAEWGMLGENGTLAIITFKIKRQPTWPEEITTYLGLFRIRAIGATGDMVPFDTPVNGTVIIRGFAGVGRQIDVYGGASNAGYGPFPDPWPRPYGGQGPNKPMDLVIPQSEVVLYASVLYNYWPVQSKDVCFEVEGPFEHVNGQLVPKPN
ncbi:MAG: cohesin domain-containing protein, partial [Candidatus Bathyarchaeia archaeon]